MRSTMRLLTFLALTIGYSISHAQQASYKSIQHETKAVSLTRNSPASNKPDDLKTQLAVYGLIIGIYALYGFKQKT